MEIVPFKAEHLDQLNEQVATAYLAQFMTRAQARALEGPYSFTAMESERPLICAGVIPYWDGRGEAWAMVGNDAGPHLFGITKAIKRFLRVAPFERIEAHVAWDFLNGHQWVRMLGFEFECRKAKYFPDGKPAAAYSRVT